MSEQLKKAASLLRVRFFNYLIMPEITTSNPINAQTAGDLSKQTGAAKTVLVGSTLASLGGTIAAVGSSGIVTAPVAIVVGAIVAAVGGLVALCGKLFGNKWHYSSGVRWLLQKYEYYVMGYITSTSSNHVSEALLQDCYNWFTAVVGVPIYDKYRYHALCGEWPDSGAMIEPRLSYNERALNYLAFPEVIESGITYEQAVVAAQLADQFNENGVAGSWAGFLIAPSHFENISWEQIANKELADFNNELLNPPTTVEVVTSKITEFFRRFGLIALAVVGFLLFSGGPSRKRKR